MNKLILTITLILSGFIFSDERPFQSFFGIKTSQPLAVVEAMDELSEANCPGTSSVRLMNELFNGTDETTHTIVITYPDKESYKLWAASFTTCPAAGKFLQTMSSISEQTFQFMGMPLIVEGDTTADQVFNVFLMDVSDPASYAEAYTKLMSTGQCPSSYALVAMGPGQDIEKYGTHFAYCGYKTIDAYLDDYMDNATPTKEYLKFVNEVSDIRSLKALNMSSVIKDWVPNQ